MSPKLREFLTFRYLITPILLQVVFWIFLVGVIVFGFVVMFGYSYHRPEPLPGLLIILFGPVVLRFYVELLIVMFRVHESLQKTGKK
jgi:hypothetical protein